MSRDFLNSWRDRVKQRNSQSAELKALQEELERTTAEIEDKINVEVDEDIQSMFGVLSQSAAETRQKIVQKIELEEYRREEAINNIVKSDKQAETLFNFLGEESSKFLAEPEEEPKIEMTEDVEDFLGTLGGVDVFAETIEEEIVPEQEVLIDAPTQEVVEEIMDEMVEIIAEPVEPKDVISAAAEWMDQLDEIKKEPALDDLGKLTKQVELIQNQLSTYKVGWGQEGMTYGSGEVRLEYLDDVDRTSAKTDGYVLQYQESTDSWIGGTGGNPVVSGSTSGDTLELVMEDGTTVEIGLEHAEVYLLLEDGDKILMEDSGFLVQNQLVGNPVVSGETTGDTLTLTQHDGSTVDIDVTQLNDPYVLLEDNYKIILEDDSGFVSANEVIVSNPVVSGAVSGDTMTLTLADTSTVDINVASLNREVVSGAVSGDTMTLTLDDASTISIDVSTLNREVLSGAVKGDVMTLTLDDSTTVDIDITQVGDMFVLLEDDFKILLEDDTGFIMGNHGPGVVVSGVVSDETLTLTHSDQSETTIDVTTLANLDFEPSGYEYINDSSLYQVLNDSDMGNGLFVSEGEWVRVPCNGYKTNQLPSGKHKGIAGTIWWEGSGSTTYSRIWDVNRERFYFDELSTDTIVSFRFKIDVIPETNNTLIQARINFFAIRDGNDDPVLEDATIVEEYRILLEDGDYVLDETDSDQIILELGTDMGQGDYPGAYNDTNYKIALETATDGGTGQLVGDHFQAFNFQQTVAAQELGDGAGVEQERTFVFPVYVGDTSSQRGFGYFEINSTSDLVVNDSSILAGLN